MGRSSADLARLVADPLHHVVDLVVARVVVRREADADVPISDVRSVEQVMSASVARPRLIMALLLVFAGVGVVLGAVGVYGVIAYAVGERRREIGVRIALGAEPRAVAGSVVLRGDDGSRRLPGRRAALVTARSRRRCIRPAARSS